MKYFGLVRLMIILSSSREACPDTCTGATLINHPNTLLEKTIYDGMDADLVARHRPGREDHRVTWFQLYFLWSPKAMRVSAASGSPWLPLERISTRDGL